MAKQEHVDLLKQGIEVWNQWREKHPGIRPDLRGADLRNAECLDLRPHTLVVELVGNTAVVGLQAECEVGVGVGRRKSLCDVVEGR